MRDDCTMGGERVALMLKTINHAFENGIAVTQLPRGQKAHNEKRWPDKVATNWTAIDASGDLNDYNVALVVIPERSSNFVDVDLDSEVAKRTQPYSKLPESSMVYGRPSNPASHHGYRPSAPMPNITVKGTHGATLMEARTGNRYSLAPGSIHDKDDEVYQWESCGPPCEVDADEFQCAFKEWAAMAMLASAWPARGGRSEAAGHLAGALAMGGVPVEDAERIMRGVCAGAEDEEVEQRISYVRRTYEKFERGENVTGKRSLADAMDRRTARKALDLLGAARRQPIIDTNYSDLGNAGHLIDRFGCILRYDPMNDRWYAWDGTRLRTDGHSRVYEYACETVQALVTEAGSLAGPAAQAALTWYARSHGSERISAMVREAGRSYGDLKVLEDELDADVELLNAPNGTIDLRTGELREPDIDDLITRVTAVPYDPDLPTPTFCEFMCRFISGDAEVERFLQVCAGLSVAGVVPKLMVVLEGPTDTGKTTFLTNILRAAIGNDYVVEIQADAVSTRRRDGLALAEASTYKKRLAVISEPPRNLMLNVAFIKNATGGNRQVGRVLYKGLVEFDGTATWWIDTNDLPDVPNQDDAIFNRIKRVKCTSVMPKYAGDEGHDPDFEAKIAAELPGVLAWAVEGYQRYLTEGLFVPEAVAAWTSEYEHEQNYVARFVDECLTVGSDGKPDYSLWVTVADARRHWEWWQRDNVPRDAWFLPRTFNAAMVELGFKRQRRRMSERGNATVWEGCALAELTAVDLAFTSL